MLDDSAEFSTVKYTVVYGEHLSTLTCIRSMTPIGAGDVYLSDLKARRA
jgi:hypothetical protein